MFRRGVRVEGIKLTIQFPTRKRKRKRANMDASTQETMVNLGMSISLHTMRMHIIKLHSDNEVYLVQTKGDPEMKMFRAILKEQRGCIRDIDAMFAEMRKAGFIDEGYMTMAMTALKTMDLYNQVMPGRPASGGGPA